MTKRHEQLLTLNAELAGLLGLRRFNGSSYLAAALWILAKGTRAEADVKDIILGCCPEFFEVAEGEK